MSRTPRHSLPPLGKGLQKIGLKGLEARNSQGEGPELRLVCHATGAPSQPKPVPEGQYLRVVTVRGTNLKFAVLSH